MAEKPLKIYCPEFKLSGKGETKKAALQDMADKVAEIVGTAETIKKLYHWELQDCEGFDEVIKILKSRL